MVDANLLRNLDSKKATALIDIELDFIEQTKRLKSDVGRNYVVSEHSEDISQSYSCGSITPVVLSEDYWISKCAKQFGGRA